MWFNQETCFTVVLFINKNEHYNLEITGHWKRNSTLPEYNTVPDCSEVEFKFHDKVYFMACTIKMHSNTEQLYQNPAGVLASRASELFWVVLAIV